MSDHPAVVDNFDSQIFSIDAAIRTAAQNWQFSYTLDVPTFDEAFKTPQLIYGLVSHFSKRGFQTTYDGEEGKLSVSWKYPNFTWYEAKQITRAVPTMIPSLGVGFRAGLLYMCMTNANDLRIHNDATVRRNIEKGIRDAALLGNTQMYFGFPDVPAPAVGAIFSDIIESLIEKGFIVEFDVNNNMYVIKWGQTFNLKAQSGEYSFALLE